MKKVVRLTESDLVRLVKKVLEEQTNELEGWDKLKVGEKIKLKNDRDGSISSWVVSATTPNPSKSGTGIALFLNPEDEGARKLTPSEIEVSFYPKEMKIDLPGGINSIVKDAIVKKTPTKPLTIKPDPNKPRLLQQDLDKRGFYSLYNPDKMWETSSDAFSGFHINKKNIDYGQYGLGPNKFCKIQGKTHDGLGIELQYNCLNKKLFIVMVGNQRMKREVQNLDVVSECQCPQG